MAAPPEWMMRASQAHQAATVARAHGDPAGVMEARAALVEAERAMHGEIEEVIGHQPVIGTGEVLVEVHFPVAFLGQPAITSGGGLEKPVVMVEVPRFTRALQFAPIGDNETTAIGFTGTWAEEGTVTFSYAVSSEEGYDEFLFIIDNQPWLFDSGIRGVRSDGSFEFIDETFAVPAGEHTIAWIYQKDYSGSEGLDTAFLAGITLTNLEGGARAFSFVDVPPSDFMYHPAVDGFTIIDVEAGMDLTPKMLDEQLGLTPGNYPTWTVGVVEWRTEERGGTILYRGAVLAVVTTGMTEDQRSVANWIARGRALRNPI